MIDGSMSQVTLLGPDAPVLNVSVDGGVPQVIPSWV